MSKDSIEEQYEKDLLLTPIVIENALYFDEDEDHFVNATLEFFGHSLKITTFLENGNTWKGITNKSRGDVEKEIKVEPYEEERSIIKIGDNEHIFVVSNFDAEIVLEHYNELNKEFIEGRLSFRSTIDKISRDLLENETITSLIENYIEDTPNDVFFDYKIIAGIEYKLIQRNKIGKDLLITTQEIRDSLLLVKEEKEGIQISRYIYLENQDEVDYYFKNKLNLLSQVLGSNLAIDDEDISIYLTYRLVYLYSIKYFADYWKSNYGNYFTNISGMTIRDAVQSYCSIETVVPKRLGNAAPFIYFLMDNQMFDNDNYINCYADFVDILNEVLKQKELSDFANKLTRKNTNENKYTINDIDFMTGQEFENFVQVLFANMGYSSEVTKTSGDQGIDIIAEKNGYKIGVQAKCYSSSVSNKAIQEVVAGINFYNLDKGIVITNNYFTNSAKDLAISNNIVLWDRNILKEKISEFL